MIESVKDSGLPLRSISDLKEEAERICGRPRKPEFDERIVAAVKWVDGTVIDVVRKIRQ